MEEKRKAMSRVMDRLQARQDAFSTARDANHERRRLEAEGEAAADEHQPCDHELVQALPRDVLFAANGTREEEGFGDVTDKS